MVWLKPAGKAGTILQTARGLSLKDWKMLVSAYLLLAVSEVCLRLLSPSQVFRIFGVNNSISKTRDGWDPSMEPNPYRVIALVDLAARNNLFNATCLRQTLTVHWLFRKMRVKSSLAIGIRRSVDGLTAHAWLETSALSPKRLFESDVPYARCFRSPE